MSDSPSPRSEDVPDGPDSQQRRVERINAIWPILDTPVTSTGLRAVLTRIMRRLMGLVLVRQQEFNAAVVDYLNHNVQRTIQRLDSLDVIHDEVERHRELLLARDRRGAAALAALTASHEELRASFGVLQQASQNLKREVERLRHDRPAAAPAGAVGPVAATPIPTGDEAAAPQSQFDVLDSHKYVGFEDQFRGSAEDIRARVSEYLPIFEGARDVLDIGCGRGEFLALLRDHGVSARGIDLNPAMIDVCHEKGLDATATDALAYLRAQPDQSLGGLFAAQVVEHLEPRYLTQLLDLAFDKLRPGAPIVLETINPACWFAFFESYIRDITHVRPLHPDTLKYLLVASGFQQVDIRYRAPYPEVEKLQPVGTGAAADAAVVDWADTLNANVEKINRLLFTWLDYAAVGRRA